MILYCTECGAQRDWATVSQAARALGVTEGYVRAELKRGRYHGAVKVQNPGTKHATWRIPGEAVEAHYRARREG